MASPYEGNQLGDPNLQELINATADCPSSSPSMSVWKKPYELPGGDALYFGVSPVDSGSEQILVPFSGVASISFKSKYHPEGVPKEAVCIKYEGKAHEKIFTTMNDMLDTVVEELKSYPLESELGQRLMSKLGDPKQYPRRDNAITAKFKVKDGNMLTSFVGIADYEAFKKKAMTFIAKKKPVPVMGVFHVQGVVLSERGLDVCVKLWEISVRK